MPAMYEIYDHDATGYDELISREDYSGNLRTTLRDRFHWRGARVVEAGIGSGRVTNCYIDLVSEVLGFDRSVHMLEQAGRNLEPWTGKVRLMPADHLSLPVSDDSADIFVEGWAFGHLVLDRAEQEDGGPTVTREAPDAAERAPVAQAAAELVAEAQRVTRSGGTLILIETLGTNVDEPGAPHPVLGQFYSELETRHGFSSLVIRTDYRFESAEAACRLCGYFFGDDMREGVMRRLELLGRTRSSPVVIPEFTGIWMRE